MNSNDTRLVASKAKRHLKRNIAKAWYKLDKTSYNQWLEGRNRSGNTEFSVQNN